MGASNNLNANCHKSRSARRGNPGARLRIAQKQYQRCRAIACVGVLNLKGSPRPCFLTNDRTAGLSSEPSAESKVHQKLTFSGLLRTRPSWLGLQDSCGSSLAL